MIRSLLLAISFIVAFAAQAQQSFQLRGDRVANVLHSPFPEFNNDEVVAGDPKNLWRFVENGQAFIQVEEWFANGGWGQIADAQYTHENGVWNITTPDGMGGAQWQGQFSIHTTLTAQKSKSYNFRCKVLSDQSFWGVTIKLVERNYDSEKRDGNMFFDGRHQLTAGQTLEYVAENVQLSQDDAHALALYLDLGGAPNGTHIQVSDIYFEEIGGDGTLDNASQWMAAYNAANAFDGNPNTFFTAGDADRAFAGLELTEKNIITKVAWTAPVTDDKDRKNVCLGVFEGANDPNFLDAVPIYIIKETNCQPGRRYEANVNVSRGFKYVRYVGPAGSHATVADLEFWGYPGEGDDSHFYQLTNIPTISIHTVEGIDPFDKETDLASYVSFIYEDGSMIQENNQVSSRQRGNASRQFAKKPYRLKFEKKTTIFPGSELETPAKAKKWTLINNWGDKTLLRNLVAFEMSRRMDLRYTSYAQPVDVIMNGEYKGCYQLCDQMEVYEGRVDIGKASDTTIEAPEDLAYFLEIDAYAHDEPVEAWFDSQRNNIPVTIKYPADDEITPAQHDYAKALFDEMEASVYAGDYAAHLDPLSWSQHYIIGELSGNTDTYWSTYLYRYVGDDRFYVGPVWDFDIAFDNDYRTHDNLNNPNADYIWRSGASLANGMPDFVGTVLNQNQAVLRATWTRARDTQRITAESLNAYIDARAAELQQAQALNFLRWPILNQVQHMNYTARGTYDAEVQAVKDYLTKRIAWLDTKMGYTAPTGTYYEYVDNNQYFRIRNNQDSKRYLTINKSGVAAYAKVDMSDASQVWRLVRANASNSVEVPRYYLEAQGQRIALNGNQFSMSNNGQPFYLVPFGENVYAFDYATPYTSLTSTTAMATTADGVTLGINSGAHSKWLLEPASELDVKMSVDGYSTLYADFPLQLTDDLYAYTWEGLEADGTIARAELGTLFPEGAPVILDARTPVIVQSATGADTFTLPILPRTASAQLPAAAKAQAVGQHNKLRGALLAGTAPGTDAVFTLARPEGDATGFYVSDTRAVAKNSAYYAVANPAVGFYYLDYSRLDLVDGTVFENDAGTFYNEINYTRNFKKTTDQALYVPFEMEYNDWKENYNVYDIYNVISFFNEETGELERTTLYTRRLKDGSHTEANRPYIIRAKNLGEQTITVKNATLYPSEENYVDCSSVFERYIFQGTYDYVYNLKANNYIAYGSNGLSTFASDTAKLGPMRWYLNIVDRQGESVAPAKLIMQIIGEDETTGIEEIELSRETIEGLFDLSGRRISEDNIHYGTFIKNGRKQIK